MSAPTPKGQLPPVAKVGAKAVNLLAVSTTDKVERAKGGSVEDALELLGDAVRHLRRGEPLPKYLATYLADAFDDIIRQARPRAETLPKVAPPAGLTLPPAPPVTDRAAFLEWARSRFGYRQPDATGALHLKRGKGQKNAEALAVRDLHVALAVHRRLRETPPPARKPGIRTRRPIPNAIAEAVAELLDIDARAVRAAYWRVIAWCEQDELDHWCREIP